jgi:hypothetical protein
MNWIHITPEFGRLYGVPIFALTFALFLAWSAESLGGVAALSGTFLAGFGLSRINARRSTRSSKPRLTCPMPSWCPSSS